MTKDKFLEALANCGQELDTFISRFMDIKENIGNGVGAGKLFENLLVGFINNKMEGLHAVHLNLSNSHFIWDIIVSENPDVAQHRDAIVQAVRANGNPEAAITAIIGDQWIGNSLKTYKNDDCQITTDYSYRTWLEQRLGQDNADAQASEEFFALLNKHDKDRYITLALNTYDHPDNARKEIAELERKTAQLDARTKKGQTQIAKNLEKIQEIERRIPGMTKEYAFRLLSFDKPFDAVEYKKNSKHSQYQLMTEGKSLFKVLYGKNQANPFQRGIWTHNKSWLEYFPLVRKGEYQTDGFFERSILSTIYL